MTVLRGVHCNNLSAAFPWLRRVKPALVKAVNASAADFAQLRAECQPQTVIARFTLDHPNLTTDATATAAYWWATTRSRVLAVKPYVDYVEVPVNEAYERRPELDYFARASAEYVKLAAQHGVKCIVGNFARGTPEVADFPAFALALEAASQHGGALGLHEYHHKHNLDIPWQIGRVKQFYDALPPALRIPVYLTEFGLDNGDLPGYERSTAGWRHAGYADAEGYAADMAAGCAWYAANAPYVQGVAVFNAGDYDNTWQSFEVMGPPSLELFFSVKTQPTPPVDPPRPEEPPMSFPTTDQLSASLAAEFGDAFEDVRGRLPDGDYGLGWYDVRPVSAITEIAIHHTATPPTVTVEAIHYHHTARNHWSGTGYTVFIDGAAKVYLTGTLETARAHVGGTDPVTGQAWNWKTVGVCLAGSFMDYQPTDAQKDAAGRVLACLYQVIGEKQYRGHKEFNGGVATACPGATWWNWQDDIAPPVSVVPPMVDMAKVVYFLEEAQRAAEQEGLTVESRYIGENYTQDAIAKRDGQ